MRLLSAALVVSVLSTPAAAQTRSESQAYVSIFGGLIDAGDLWSVPAQRASVIGGGREVAVDTFAVARQAKPGFVVGVGLTVFMSRHIALTGEFSYAGLGYRDDCEVKYLDSSIPRFPNDANTSYCDRLSQGAGTAGAINFTAGVFYRTFPQWPAYPYARLLVGLADQGGSTVELATLYASSNRPLIADPEYGKIRPTILGAIGLLIATAPGYQLRLEARDQLYQRDIVTGPANNLLIAPVSKQWRHNVVLTASIDIVLERKRGRRY